MIKEDVLKVTGLVFSLKILSMKHNINPDF